jgi:hypothetical protein
LSIRLPQTAPPYLHALLSRIQDAPHPSASFRFCHVACHYPDRPRTDAKNGALEDLTWTELRDQIHAGKITIIIPIGGTEQSGPDVALGKHNARVKVLSQRIAEGLGNALVAPVIAYVPEGGYAPPTSHMRFAHESGSGPHKDPGRPWMQGS